MSSVNTQEISHFQKDSAHWWDEKGPFAPLHKMNPTRLEFIRDNIVGHFDKDEDAFNVYKGLNFLDIGCGGGLVCEPLARLGGKITGLDADKQAISVAQDHAKNENLDISYLNTTAEQLVLDKKTFDVVTALEIIEHVDNREEFLKNCLKLVKPNGLLVLSTLNRTVPSLLFGKLAAEYVLGLVPAGTHDWNKFVKPSEIQSILLQENAITKDIKGITYNLLKDKFKLNSKDMNINYILCATRKSI